MEIKKLKLTSLNTEEYPDIEVDCMVVDDIKIFTKNLLQRLSQIGERPKTIARKTAKVTARLGKLDEEVDTRPRVERDGRLYAIGETKSRVKVEGSMIVQNPDGEAY